MSREALQLDLLNPPEKSSSKPPRNNSESTTSETSVEAFDSPDSHQVNSDLLEAPILEDSEHLSKDFNGVHLNLDPSDETKSMNIGPVLRSTPETYVSSSAQIKAKNQINEYMLNEKAVKKSDDNEQDLEPNKDRVDVVTSKELERQQTDHRDEEERRQKQLEQQRLDEEKQRREAVKKQQAERQRKQREEAEYRMRIQQEQQRQEQCDFPSSESSQFNVNVPHPHQGALVNGHKYHKTHQQRRHANKISATADTPPIRRQSERNLQSVQFSQGQPIHNINHGPAPTPFFDRIVSEEVQELKEYSRIIKAQHAEISELKNSNCALESDLEIETMKRIGLETALEEQERLYKGERKDLISQRDELQRLLETEKNTNKKLWELIYQKEKEIQKAYQYRVSESKKFFISFRTIILQ